ncbi:MAG: nucleoside deaminase [Lachnospiraceae bacterium]|nr:nucleoside deaminase [Lachnospiraceae bacterium]
MTKIHDDRYYMQKALIEARKAYNNGDTPIGCVIVYKENKRYDRMTKIAKKMGIKDGDIISRAYNKRNLKHTAIAHAEIYAIDKACKKIKDFRLESCTMYVTLEPCQMCAGAIVQSRIDRLVIGAMSKKSGSCGSIIDILGNDEFNHKVEVNTGVMEEECSDMLKSFFKEIRDGRIDKKVFEV